MDLSLVILTVLHDSYFRFSIWSSLHKSLSNLAVAAQFCRTIYKTVSVFTKWFSLKYAIEPRQDRGQYSVY